MLASQLRFGECGLCHSVGGGSHAFFRVWPVNATKESEMVVPELMLPSWPKVVML